MVIILCLSKSLKTSLKSQKRLMIIHQINIGVYSLQQTLIRITYSPNKNGILGMLSTTILHNSQLLNQYLMKLMPTVMLKCHLMNSKMLLLLFKRKQKMVQKTNTKLFLKKVIHQEMDLWIRPSSMFNIETQLINKQSRVMNISSNFSPKLMETATRS